MDNLVYLENFNIKMFIGLGPWLEPRDGLFDFGPSALEVLISRSKITLVIEIDFFKKLSLRGTFDFGGLETHTLVVSSCGFIELFIRNPYSQFIQSTKKLHIFYLLLTETLKVGHARGLGFK